MTTPRFAVRSLSCIALANIIAACSSTPPPAAQPRPASRPPVAAAPAPATSPDRTGSTEIAIVYIYRPKSFFGMALHPTVMLDGKDLINIGNGRVFRGEFEPARRAFRMDDGESGAEIDLKAGETYYMKVVIVPGFWPRRSCTRRP